MASEAPATTIALATPDDAAAARAIAQAGYSIYTPRLGRPPKPMLDDYAARQRAGQLHVARLDGEIVGLVVIETESDHLLLQNIAVRPDRQRQGIGRALMRFVEGAARARGLPEVRLYTHVTMVENVARYLRLGYVETHRGGPPGFERVFMRKVVA